MLTETQRKTFETIEAAATHGDLALVETTDRETGEPVAVIAAVNRPAEPDGEYELVPLASLFTYDPYERLEPPTTEEG